MASPFWSSISALHRSMTKSCLNLDHVFAAGWVMKTMCTLSWLVLAGRDAIRGMLARLQPKEEVILLGWGVPMPLVIRSRRYDDTFWKEILGKTGSKADESRIMKELGFRA